MAIFLFLFTRHTSKGPTTAQRKTSDTIPNLLILHVGVSIREMADYLRECKQFLVKILRRSLSPEETEVLVQ